MIAQRFNKHQHKTICRNLRKEARRTGPRGRSVKQHRVGPGGAWRYGERSQAGLSRRAGFDRVNGGRANGTAIDKPPAVVSLRGGQGRCSGRHDRLAPP